MLLDGRAVLFLGGGEERVEDLVPVVMEPGRLYNVKCNAWHTIALSHDATILLVENRDIGEANTEYSLLRAVHYQLIIDTARREQPGEWDAA